MPAPRGAILTDRDRALLAFAAIARYVSAEQVHRLFFDGSSKKQTYHRLAKLCQPGARPGEGACLRRLQYRRADGAPAPVWALAPHGLSVAERELPWLGSPPATDVGARFLEHTLILNDVLAGLVLRLRRNATASLGDLPFRWHAENDDALSFQALDPRTREWHRAALKPDAVVEVAARRRRLFIEAETGTQSIATANPQRTGAVLAKLTRYRIFFTVPAVDEAVLPQLRDAYNEFAESFNATRRVIVDHNAPGGPQLQLPPAPREAMGLVRDFLARLLASSRRTDAGSARTTGS